MAYLFGIFNGDRIWEGQGEERREKGQSSGRFSVANATVMVFTHKSLVNLCIAAHSLPLKFTNILLWEGFKYNFTHRNKTVTLNTGI